MSSLDKHTLYYFRDELEKTAIIVPMAKGVAKMVFGAGKAATKGAYQGTKGMHKFFTNRLAAKQIAEGGTAGALHHLGGGLLTAGAIAGAGYGAKKGFDTFKENRQQLQQLGPVRQAGIQEL